MPEIWVKLDKKTGHTLEVVEGGTHTGGKPVKKYPDPTADPGRKKMKKKKGDKTNHGKNIPKDPDDKQILPTDPGSDPCCYRDPETGDEWCWC